MKPCSADAFHELWLAFHANPTTLDEIRVPLREFDEVSDCHKRLVPEFNVASVQVRNTGVGAKRVLVRRKALFEMLVAHGKVCQ